MNSDTSGIGVDETLEQDNLYSYCRVDFLQPNEPKESILRSPKSILWHCSECGDGPYGHWQNVCMRCEHKMCNHCAQEEIQC